MNAATYLIDGPILNLFNKVHVENKLGKGPFICKEKFLVAKNSREINLKRAFLVMAI